MSESSEDDQIVQKMEAVRRELDDDVDEIVENARVMVDWRHYVRTYPWICLGAAVAVGYFIVPRPMQLIRPDTETVLRLAKKNRLLVMPESQSKQRVGGTVLSFVTDAVIRSAVGYLGEKIGEMIVGNHPDESKPS